MWSFRTSLLSMFAAVVLFALSGCAPRIHVVSQVNPSPMKKSSTFDVEPLTFENLQVGGKTDSEYSKSLKKDTTAGAWEDDKKEIASAFAMGFSDSQKELRTVDSGGELVVKANCAFVEPGYFAWVSNEVARVRIRVKIFTHDGALVDELDIEGQALTADKRTRLKAAGVEAGMFLAKYLRKRTAG
jgi:hypothetical protein